MPSQALALALAASIYPPAVAAVIALGRGAQVRSRVFAFVLAAALTTYAMGIVILLVLIELGATGSVKWTPSAAVDLALGIALLLLALRLRRQGVSAAAEKTAGAADTRAGDSAPGEDPAPSKIERYLQSRRLAFVLGITLYVLPSPIYIGAVKAIADAKLSTANEVLALVAVVAVMLWMIELPMVMLLAIPTRASATLEGINLWFARNGRLLAVFAAVGTGLYLAIRGLAGLLN
jgi:hypothetical protein